MGYLFLLISVLAGNIKGYCGKKTGGFVRSYSDAMLANTIRMILCIIIGFLTVVFTGKIPLLTLDLRTLLITLFSGVATSAFVVFWLISVKQSAYMMLDVFLMLGTIVPMAACKLLFNEHILWYQYIGLAVLIAAVLIMCSYNNSIKSALTPRALILLIITGAANGLSDLSQKLYVKTVSDGSAAVFNLYTYIFSALVLAVCFLIFSNREKTDIRTSVKPIFGYITVMSLCLFLNSFFKTVAASYLDSAQLYPMSQGLSIIGSSIMSATLFKEKLTVKCIIGLIMAFAALLIINLPGMLA